MQRWLERSRVDGGVACRRSRRQRGGDEAAIAKVRTAYQTAAGAQDGRGLAKLYAPDGVEMPPNAPAAKGRAAIEAFHKAFGQQWMMHGMTITPTETKVHGRPRLSTSAPTSRA